MTSYIIQNIPPITEQRSIQHQKVEQALLFIMIKGEYLKKKHQVLPQFIINMTI